MRQLTWLSVIAIAILAVGAFTTKSATLPVGSIVSIDIMEMQIQAGALPVMLIENPV
jgi:hypothetical protein